MMDEPADQTPDFQIVFRRLTEGPTSGGRNDVEHWQVDCYNQNRSYPAGIAWALIFPAGSGVRPVIEHVLVDDARRRRGVATALVIACRKRWRGIRIVGDSTPGAHA